MVAILIQTRAADVPGSVPLVRSVWVYFRTRRRARYRGGPVGDTAADWQYKPANRSRINKRKRAGGALRRCSSAAAASNYYDENDDSLSAGSTQRTMQLITVLYALQEFVIIDYSPAGDT